MNPLNSILLVLFLIEIAQPRSPLLCISASIRFKTTFFGHVAVTLFVAGNPLSQSLSW
jgi:hypothetical protein